ncbi:MAG: DUF89 family protein [Anaerolineae bacterium]|nr:DUF89 family protein [Anaerolineae bacterium]
MPSTPGGFMPRPASIRTDHTNAFANRTMRVRVPQTLQDTLDNNPAFPDSIKDSIARLRDEIAGNARIRSLALPAPDYEEWIAQVAPHTGETWHATEWFFAEVYTYRLLMEAVRWWEIGQDPFLPVKAEEEASPDLWAMIEEALEAHHPGQPPEERVSGLLHRALWGNRIDLSYKWSLDRGTAVSDDDLLVDHSPAVVRHLLSTEGPVHVMMDNYGREMAMDLALIDTLLEVRPGPVLLHFKAHPTFVSDATVPDMQRFMALMGEQGGATRALVERLVMALDGGRLRFLPEPYWNSTRALSNLPPRLKALFSRASLVIVKGDLHYRRVVGDAIWPAGATFADAVRGFPAPLVALRAMKSDPLVGVPRELAAKLDAADPDWHWNGKHGLLQSSL